MAELTGDELIERMNATMPPTGRLLGQKIVEADPDAGTVTIEYEAKPDFCNPMGSVQGGFVSAMLDDAAAIACVIASRGKVGVPTLEMKVSFLRAARPGKLCAVGKVMKMGRSIAFLESHLYDGEGKLLAHSTQTAKPIPFERKS
jgi:uncharacterized protein (TIGR00369 family)